MYASSHSKYFAGTVLLTLTLLTAHGEAQAEEPQEPSCTERAECWPLGSSMRTGLELRERRDAAEKTLKRSHDKLLALISSKRSTDQWFGNDERLLMALKSQQAAWLKYTSEECELVGSLTMSGGTWPSTYATRCELNHIEQRIRRVRSATRCIHRPSFFAQEDTCLQQLAPLSNK